MISVAALFFELEIDFVAQEGLDGPANDSQHLTSTWLVTKNNK